MESRTWKFEKREGESGYIWATGSDGCRFNIYLQYGSVEAVTEKTHSEFNFDTFKLETTIVETYPEVELSAEERAELVAQARSFDSGQSVQASEKSEAAPVELPGDVAALVSRYGSSEAAWEAENESACFKLREYRF